MSSMGCALTYNEEEWGWHIVLLADVNDVGDTQWPDPERIPWAEAEELEERRVAVILHGAHVEALDAIDDAMRITAWSANAIDPL